MKKNLSHFKLAIAFVAILFGSCQKEINKKVIIPQDELKTISAQVTDLFFKSKTNWNKYAISTAELISFKEVGTVSSKEAKQTVIAELAKDENHVAYGNLLEPGNLQLLTVKQLANSNATTRQSLINNSDSAIQIGNKIVDIIWKTKQGSFVTKCFVNENEIVWDNILTSVVLVNPEPIVTLSNESENTQSRSAAGYYVAWYKHTSSWQGNWIWGSKRGDMGYTITIHCYSNGKVYSTDVTDWANMTLGSAKSESKTLVNSGSYGKCQYALGIATPFASVKFSSSNFEVEVSGIGSSMVRNGTKTLIPWLVY